ncbi:MAG: V-type ATPase subunit, partial [Bacteroidales bacterium]|nr:V-type ATPase subunit [Bacteroidales bacterium]
MAGPLAKYAFVNAKLRARISNILAEERFQQLVKASTLDATLSLLRDTPFADLESVYATTGDLKQAELELLRKEIALYTDIRTYLHRNTQPVVEALLARFEIDNLKNAIRVFFDRRVRERSVDDSMHYVLQEPILHELPISIILHAQSFDEIAGLCQGTPYQAIIRKYCHMVEDEGSLFRMEVAFDHYYYETLLTALGKLAKKDRSLAMRLVGIEIDIQNISWLMRLKTYYDLPLEEVLNTLIPGGHSLKRPLIDDLYRAQNVTSVLQDFVKDQYPGLSTLLGGKASDSASRLQILQRILEEIKRQEVQRIMVGYPFTIGILLAYYFLKGEELAR